MIALVKALHLAAIAIWSAGLVSLPSLYVQRSHIRSDEELYRLQRIVRFAYVAILSPAAFTAIASGIALIFLREVSAPWFSYKLALVAVMTVLHVLTGLVIIRLFREGEIYPVWRFISATAGTGIVVVGVLVLVLAKPEITIPIPAALNEPGGLKRLARALSPWTIP